ncbi:hypothetical protein [Halalkalibacter alkaliphilus]|uniref:Uncharacterized protein n=1 Tax=Halalkalibacter alkaliphilus TaxID=2917993 RepID=A0A9X2CTK5_9BACI|nr:hypothetical protein [Halalkalibacter alkaliphilus]MCL7748020.1 hypothetical protein [Halalkalibacter alkaliphilus]
MSIMNKKFLIFYGLSLIISFVFIFLGIYVLRKEYFMITEVHPHGETIAVGQLDASTYKPVITQDGSIQSIYRDDHQLFYIATKEGDLELNMVDLRSQQVSTEISISQKSLRFPLEILEILDEKDVTMLKMLEDLKDSDQEGFFVLDMDVLHQYLLITRGSMLGLYKEDGMKKQHTYDGVALHGAIDAEEEAFYALLKRDDQYYIYSSNEEKEVKVEITGDFQDAFFLHDINAYVIWTDQTIVKVDMSTEMTTEKQLLADTTGMEKVADTTMLIIEREGQLGIYDVSSRALFEVDHSVTEPMYKVSADARRLAIVSKEGPRDSTLFIYDLNHMFVSHESKVEGEITDLKWSETRNHLLATVKTEENYFESYHVRIGEELAWDSIHGSEQEIKAFSP